CRPLEHDPRRNGGIGRRDRHGGEVYAYRRTGRPCLVCGTPIAHAEHVARNLFWCPTCQPAAGA
ncbi:MAG: zinc finger domain-containing protein, partial [Pseudonocardia sp.]